MSNDYPETIKPGYRPCRSCEREHPAGHLVDGWCPQCMADDPEDYRRKQYERDAQRRSLSIKQLHCESAALLRRQAKQLSERAARLLCEEALRLERAAASWPDEKGGAA